MSSTLFPTSHINPVNTNTNDSTLAPLPALDSLTPFTGTAALTVTPSRGDSYPSPEPASSPETSHGDDYFLDERHDQSYESPCTDHDAQIDDECVSFKAQRPDVRDLAVQHVLPGALDTRTLRLQLHDLPEPKLGEPAPIARTFVDVPSLSGARIMFDIVGLIAGARFSQVWGAIASTTDTSMSNFPKHVAIKIFWKGTSYTRSDAFGALWTENRIMKQLAESRTLFVNAALAIWQDDNYVYLASPRYTSALDDYILSFSVMPSGPLPKVMPPAMFRVYAAELLLALDGLRVGGIVHGDIKTGNVLVSPSGHLALADFDCSYVGLPTSEDEYWNRRLDGFMGTLEYQAPECIFGMREDVDWTEPANEALLATPRADMWSLGLVLLELALQEPYPFFLSRNDELRKAGDDWELSRDAMSEILETWEFEDQLQVHAELYPTVKSFLSKLLTKDPTERLTAAQAMQEPLFSGLNWDELRAGKLPDGLVDPPLVRQQNDRYSKTWHSSDATGEDILRAPGSGPPAMQAGARREPVSFSTFDDWVSPAVLDGKWPGFAHGETILARKDVPCGCERMDCQQPCLYW